MEETNSMLTVDLLHIAPDLASQVFVFTNASHLGSSSQVPPYSSHQNLGPTLEAGPGLCRCISARHQPRPLRLTPTAVPALETSPSSCEFTH